MPSEKPSSFPTVSERLVCLHDHTTSVRESVGTGIPVILIHALSMDSHFWANGVFEILASSPSSEGVRRRVIAYDLRGHGKAVDAPLTASVEQLADDLRELCAIEKLAKVDVVGTSYGGAVAQYFLLANTDLVRSATSMGTTFKGVPAFADRATIAEANGLESLYEPTLARWFLPETIETDASCVQYAKKRLASTRTENWAAAWRAMSKADCFDQLQDIQVPVLCLAGRQDTSTPPKLLKKISSACKMGVYRELSTECMSSLWRARKPLRVNYLRFWIQLIKTHKPIDRHILMVFEKERASF